VAIEVETGIVSGTMEAAGIRTGNRGSITIKWTRDEDGINLWDLVDRLILGHSM